MNDQRLMNNSYETGNRPQHNVYSPLTVKDWLMTYLLVCIPVVGIIQLFTWAYSTEINPSKANWAKATLIWMVIVVAITVIFYAIVAAIVLAPMMNLLSQ